LMEDVSHSSDLERLKTSLHYTVGELSTEKGRDLGIEFDKSVVAAVSSITHQYIQTCATDLQAFAKHAKRAVIQPDDVLLLTRRNPDLEKSLSQFADSIKKAAPGGRSVAKASSTDKASSKAAAGTKKRKAGPTAGSSKFKHPRFIE